MFVLAGRLVRREAAQDQLDDALGEPFVDRAAGDQQPVEQRPAEHVERELEIQVGAQVAAIDAALEHRAKRRPAPGSGTPRGRRARARPSRLIASTRLGITAACTDPL